MCLVVQFRFVVGCSILILDSFSNANVSYVAAFLMCLDTVIQSQKNMVEGQNRSALKFGTPAIANVLTSLRERWVGGTGKSHSFMLIIDFAY